MRRTVFLELPFVCECTLKLNVVDGVRLLCQASTYGSSLNFFESKKDKPGNATLSIEA